METDPYAPPTGSHETNRPSWSRRLGCLLLCLAGLLLARLLWIAQNFGWDFRPDELNRWLVMAGCGCSMAALGIFLMWRSTRQQRHPSRQSGLMMLFCLLAILVATGCSPIITSNEGSTKEATSATVAIQHQSDQTARVPPNDALHAIDQQPKSGGEEALASWPNWMGPEHDGVSQETGWSTEWPQLGLPEVWSREIGIGFSSITIEDNRLFTMGHVEGREVVYCIHAATGELIWSHSYPGELVDNLHDGGPGSTPTIDGEFVYTLGREGQLFCLQATDGEVVWQKELQQDLQVPMPEWGFTSSAYILNDQLILEAGRVVSYNKHTGDKNWQTAEHAAGYGSAVSFERDGATLLATLDCDGLRVTDSAAGREVAFYPWDSPFLTNSTTPIVHDDLIYVSTGYQIGCGLFRLAEDQLELIYSNRQMRNHFNNSVLIDGYLYGFDGNSNLGRVVQLTCMDFATGEVAWKQRGLGCGSLMVANGMLVILSEDGTLVIAKASPDGFAEVAWSPFLEGLCWTVPLLLDGHIFGRDAAGKLVCVKLPHEPQPRDDGAL